MGAILELFKKQNLVGSRLSKATSPPPSSARHLAEPELPPAVHRPQLRAERGRSGRVEAREWRARARIRQWPPERCWLAADR